MLTNLISELAHKDQLTGVVVVDNGYDPPFHTYHPNTHFIRDAENPPNLSRLWNLGLRYVADKEAERVASVAPNKPCPNDYYVAVLNDDLMTLPDRFVSRLAEAMQDTNAAAAYPDQHLIGRGVDGPVIVHTKATPVSLYTRLTGYAFALRGSAGLYADENLRWWYGDDDLDWRAREAGGSVLVGGLRVTHVSPNQSTVGELAAQVEVDRKTFIAKWGRAPW